MVWCSEELLDSVWVDRAFGIEAWISIAGTGSLEVHAFCDRGSAALVAEIVLADDLGANLTEGEEKEVWFMVATEDFEVLNFCDNEILVFEAGVWISEPVSEGLDIKCETWVFEALTWILGLETEVFDERTSWARETWASEAEVLVATKDSDVQGGWEEDTSFMRFAVFFVFETKEEEFDTEIWFFKGDLELFATAFGFKGSCDTWDPFSVFGLGSFSTQEGI